MNMAGFLIVFVAVALNSCHDRPGHWIVATAQIKH